MMSFCVCLDFQSWRALVFVVLLTCEQALSAESALGLLRISYTQSK